MFGGGAKALGLFGSSLRDWVNYTFWHLLLRDDFQTRLERWKVVDNHISDCSRW